MEILQLLLYNLQINLFWERNICMENYSLEHRAIAYSDCPQNKFYHAPVTIPQDSLLICINRCGAVQETSRDFFIQRNESYPYNAIHFVTAGKGILRVRGKEYNLKAGDIFLLHPFEPHYYGSDSEDPMGLLWIEFAGHDISRLVRHITEMDDYVINGDGELLTACADIIINPHRESHIISREIYNILIEIYGKYSINTKKQDIIQQQIQSYIDEHINEDLSLPIIASHFGYNANYFSERFKRMTGMNYNRYVNERKITQACTMLLVTNLSMDQIGSNLGFYDTSHFIKRFEGIMKMSPTTYRKTNIWSGEKEKINDY